MESYFTGKFYPTLKRKITLLIGILKSLNKDMHPIKNLSDSKPSISQRKIVTLVGVSYDTVRYHMENMKKREIIVRKRNGRSGKWIVL